MSRPVFRIFSLRRILACLLIGAMTTTLVAWAIAVRTEFQPFWDFDRWDSSVSLSEFDLDSDFPVEWTNRVRQNTIMVTRVRENTNAGISLIVNDVTEIEQGSRGWVVDHRFVIIRSGWPLRSFECQGKKSFANNALNYEWSGGVEPPIMLQPEQGIPFGTANPIMLAPWGCPPIPVRPIWSGVAANTALFGGAWWILLAMSVLVQHLIRRRKNRCVHCGYSLYLLESPKCPECGWGRDESNLNAEGDQMADGDRV